MPSVEKTFESSVPPQAQQHSIAGAEPSPPGMPLKLRDFLVAIGAAAACALMVVVAPAQAAQAIDIRDGDTTVVRISIRDQTRLRAERGRLLDVIGDVYDKDQNPTGRLVVLKDEAAGEYYVKPMADASGQATPVKLDVKSDRGTVGLLLQPADVVGNTLTLRVSGGEMRNASNDPSTKTRSGSHLRAIKALTLAMASPGLSSEVATRPVAGAGEVVGLWQEARFILRARFEAPGLIGEAYELTNVSNQPMVIDERELDLAPGETTPVWIVRQAGERD